MKRLFFMAAAIVVTCLSSCKYDDDEIWNSFHGLENRVAKLEELCKQMNTNISSMQTIITALQTNDYVTSVAPVTKNGETIGYTISFTKSAPVTIYHGKDGANGSDGKDGHTPVIGVRQDTDGIYYWTLDGDWLFDGSSNKIKAEGRDGQNGSDGKDGENGADGQPGAPGKDGITPQLKIEEGYWYVSTDNGSTWTNIGKATGEDGKDGTNTSDSMFRSVTQDDENVYFALASGETIILPKKQQLTITFAEGNELFFDVDQTITVNYTIVGGSDKNVVKAEMQNLDGSYTLRTTQTSAAKGTIAITAKVPTANRVIVSVSDGKQTVMEAIAVGLKASFDGSVVTVETPGTLASLIADYDKTTISELTVIGNLNSSDITTLDNLPNLTKLDLSNTNMQRILGGAFLNNSSIQTIILPRTLRSIGDQAFRASSISSIIIPEGVESIEGYAFYYCTKLKTIILPSSLTTIGRAAFMEALPDNIYCKATTPPTLENNVFNYRSCILHIPTGYIEAYKAAGKWSEFNNIIETDFSELN